MFVFQTLQFHDILKTSRDKSNFVKSHFKSNNKYKQDEISQMFDLFVLFGGRVFQQTTVIPMGTNCAVLIADLFLHSYGEDFLQGLFKNKDIKLVQTFSSSFRYIDDVLSLNYSRFGDYLHLIPIQMSL
jgi:hypothetical protein